tara:strand:+ start:18710 stop:19378 length:669 start_codon:yes stop_codon:yes gene_type:complete
MTKLTVDDIVDSLGYDNITMIGHTAENRYLKDAVRKYIQEKLSVAHYLNLHELKKQKLIDIGTGAGWFPYICKMYGHECIGTDFLGRKEYDPVYKFLDIDVREELIHANTPFGLEDKVDYIVSLRAFFPNRPKIWTMPQWKYFFKDIIKNINNNGGMYLGCNKGRRGQYAKMPQWQTSHWGPKDVGDMLDPFCVTPDKSLFIKPNTVYLKYTDIVKLGETND